MLKRNLPHLFLETEKEDTKIVLELKSSPVVGAPTEKLTDVCLNTHL